MDKKLAFQILDIAQTKDEEPIRSSYLALLKETNPEDDPEGFKRLREAYEEALRFAAERGTEEEEEEPQDEVGIWMKRVREVYRDILLRRDAGNWEPLFEDPVCAGFDTFWKRGKDSFFPFGSCPSAADSVGAARSDVSCTGGF